jgi:DNA-directed RNA polymerase subunit A'
MQAEIIDSVKFGIISPDQIKRLSVVKLSVPDTYNEDGYPIDGGLLDQRLGVIDPGLVCKTCGARAKTCPGHFGHIELVRPVIHSEFSKIIYMILQSTCRSCHRILLNSDGIKLLAEKSKGIVALEDEVLTAVMEEKEEDTKKSDEKSILKKLRSIKKCPHCGTVQAKIKFSAPTYFYVDDRKLKPDEIRDSLAGVSSEDLRILGVDPDASRPEWLILNLLLVPPVNVRPSITLESGERSEDDLTHKLVDIMRINQRLGQNINAGAPQIIIDDLWELLQYHVTAYFNNETSGIPPARHRSGRALKTLAQRLKGKEGRFRYNLSGKRVNYSARTVISVDPYIDLNEVGVPFAIAEKLTIPFYVTSWNIEKAKEFLTRTSYPMILNLVSTDGKRKRVIDANHEELLKEVKPGDILERQLMDGDIVLFNRQPSLHRMSIMAHKVKVLPGKTFRINFCVTPPYNADFDGDEMNLHVPQTLEAQAEAKYLMAVQYQIFSPRDGEAIITNNEDGITGMYFLTKDETRLTRDEATYILGLAGIYELPEHEEKGMYRGRDVFSMLLPKDLDFETKSGGGNFKITKGRLVEGVITKDTYGRGNNRLLIKIGMSYGPDELRHFLFASSKLADAYVTLAGVTVGVKEYMTDDKIEDARAELLQNTFKIVEDKIAQYKAGKLEPLIGYTRRESLERMIIVDLNLAREKAGEVLIKYIDPLNSAMQMARAGSRGSIFQYEQMSMFLGQQATLSGGRIKRGYYTNRVLPHIAPGDVRPRGRGFVATNYYTGLSPIDLFMHAVGSRGSEVYKALLTARSGYLYRRLSNALQDFYVERDLSVRDTNNNIVQTIYGGDAIDPVNVQFIKLEAKEKK